MKNKKALGLLLSLVLLLGVVLPGTLATIVEEGGEIPTPVPTAAAGNTPEPVPALTAEEQAAADRELYGKLMAAETLEDFNKLLAEAGCAGEAEYQVYIERLKALQLTEEELTKLEEHRAALTAAAPKAEPTPTTEPAPTAAPTPTPAPVPAPVCSCGCPEGRHLEGCPLFGLYERLMACRSIEEMDALLEAATEDELAALTEEQILKIEELMNALEPAPLPPPVLQDTTGEPPIVSQAICPTVSVTNVAPFGMTVTGR